MQPDRVTNQHIIDLTHISVKATFLFGDDLLRFLEHLVAAEINQDDRVARGHILDPAERKIAAISKLNPMTSELSRSALSTCGWTKS